MLSRRSFVGALTSLILFPLSSFSFFGKKKKIYLPPHGPGTCRSRIMWIGDAFRNPKGTFHIIQFWGFDGSGTVSDSVCKNGPGMAGWTFDELEYVSKNRKQICEDHGIPFLH